MLCLVEQICIRLAIHSMLVTSSDEPHINDVWSRFSGLSDIVDELMRIAVNLPSYFLKILCCVILASQKSE